MRVFFIDLLPISAINVLPGPMYLILHSSHIWEKLSFYDKYPNYGWISSAPTISYTLMILEIFK